MRRSRAACQRLYWSGLFFAACLFEAASEAPMLLFFSRIRDAVLIALAAFAFGWLTAAVMLPVVQWLFP